MRITGYFPLLLALPFAVAQDAAPGRGAPPTVNAAYVRENYTKFEYRIPMRDGVKLFTSVYIPKDVSRTAGPIRS